MKSPFLFLLFSGLLLFACTPYDDISIESPLGEVDLEVRAQPNFPEVIPLPTGFEAEGIEIGEGNDVYVTALTYSPSPVLVGAIWKGDLRTGEGSLLTEPDGLPSVGIKFDSRMEWLFVCKPYGAMIVDAESGEVMEQLFFADPATSIINDVIVTRTAAYFTDSYNPRMFRLPLHDDGQIAGMAEEIPLPGFNYVFDPDFFGINMNGIVASPNGRYLIVNNMTTGVLYRIDTREDYATEEITVTNQSPEYFQFGDGLLLDGRNLYICQNFFNKIAVVKLDPDWRGGEFVKDITSEFFHEPATIADKGNDIYAVNAYFYDTFFLGVDPATQTMEIVKVDK